MDPRLPALPIASEPDPDHVIVQADGTVREHQNRMYSAHDVGRIRAGYCCINCGESQVDHGAPFPEKCWVCGYLMRDRQLQRFGMEFIGDVRVGPSTSLEDELAVAEELYERNQLAKAGLKKTGSILVPRSF